jgi:predicted alpha/beta superfamily hydrolase
VNKLTIELKKLNLVIKFKLIGIYLLLAFLNSAFAQINIRVVSLPENTPVNSNLFISGNFNNWVANDSSYRLEKIAYGNYSIQLPLRDKPYEFKFNLGSWDCSEMAANGADFNNRKIVALHDTTIDFKIERWNSTTCIASSKKVKSYFVFSDNFPMNEQIKTRRIWIYLPPDYYQQPNKRYPVIYMHDGQNLFCDSTSKNGEWEVDETLNELFEKGDNGAIVVGIDNDENERYDEYLPWLNKELGGGKTDEYLTFITKRLKPTIDLLYRTQADRSHTAMMGSSLGALATLYAAIKNDSVFSKFGVLSPVLWIADSIYSLPRKTMHTRNSKVYLLSGVLESSSQVQETYNMRDSLLKNGFSKFELQCEIKNDGTHSEWFWKREFAEAYRWLFANQPAEENKKTVAPVEIDSTQVKNKLRIHVNDTNSNMYIEIKNENGRSILKRKLKTDQEIDLRNFRKGIYTIQINNSAFKSSTIFVKK